MRWTRDILHTAIVLWPLVTIGHLQGNRGAEGFTVFGTGEDDDLIRLLPVS